MAFKLRSGNGPLKFKEMGSTPAKHSTNRMGHESNYGKGHDNSAHPNYWKVQERTKTTSDKNLDYDEKKAKKYIDKDGDLTSSNTGSFGPYTINPDYDASATTDTRTNRKETKYYASNKDREIQDTRHYKKSDEYIGDDIYTEETGEASYTGTSTKDRVGKTDGNTYGTGSKSKSKSSSESKSESSSSTDATTSKSTKKQLLKSNRGDDYSKNKKAGESRYQYNLRKKKSK
jgi:hypothetical protein